MGSTWSCGKAVAALQPNEGSRIYYLLMEGTQESNVHPRSTSWCAIAFGTAPEVMAVVMRMAASAEGGMLKGAQGAWIKPETYIKQWREALAAPSRFEDDARCAVIRFGDGLYRVPAALRREIEDGLKGPNSWTTDEAVMLDLAGEAECDKLAQLLRDKRSDGLHTWRVFSEASRHLPVDKTLGYKPTPQKSNEPLKFRVLKLEEEGAPECGHLLVDEQGLVSKQGWAYSIVGNFVSGFAADQEARSPGSAEDWIGRFREIVRSAPVLDGGTVVSIAKLPDGNKDARYFNEHVDSIAKATGWKGCSELLRVTVAELRRARILHLVQYLKQEQVVFDRDQVLSQALEGEQKTLV